MKIYKVPSNFTKGIQEIEIIKINDENTFTYDKVLSHSIMRKQRSFNREHSADSNFFKTKKEAKVFISYKLSKAIQQCKNMIIKYELLQKQIKE